MSKNKISVIVPIYKVPEEYLRRCINSLINQTLRDIEIILVDDESPDNCGKICDEYKEKDSRIKVLHQKNKGLSGARNSGVAISSCNWITFVDGDDFIELNMLEKLYNAIDNDIDIICCGVIKDYGKKLIKYNYDNLYEHNKKYKTKSELTYMRNMLLNFNGNNAWAYAKLIKKELIINYNIYHDEKLRQGAEGLEFNIRLFGASKGIKFIKEYGYHYIYNSNSITTTHNEENHKMVLNCFKKIKDEIDNEDKELMNYFYNRMLYVVITTAISGYFSPSNPEQYRVKKEKYKEYLKNDIVKETLRKKGNRNLDLLRRITLIFIKLHLFSLVYLIANIRARQKQG